jgi:hypothetical protein
MEAEMNRGIFLYFFSISLMTDPAKATCGHTFCQKCIEKSLQGNRCCPLCKKALQRRQLKPLCGYGEFCRLLPAVYEEMGLKVQELSKRNEKSCNYLLMIFTFFFFFSNFISTL